MKETMYKMDKVEANLLKNFMYVKNQGLLFNKTNVDVNGKATIQDPDTNRPIYIGDGLVPQIERFASKYGYNKLTVGVMQTAINTMCQKAENPTGNKFTFVVNEAMWNQIQLSLSEWLSRFHTCGTYLWSKEANGYIKVGATFSTYEIGGNEITFKVDRSLSREFGDKGYGIMLDLTADKTSGQPAIAAFTFKGGEFISSKYPGVGGLDGLSSGIVSSPVAASKLIVHGLTEKVAA